MDDCDIKIGEQVLLELDEECIVGEVVHINEKHTCIQLKNCYDFYQKTISTSNSIQCFYKNEIKSIRVLNTKTTSPTTPVPLSPSSSLISNISSKALNEIKTKLNNIKILFQMDIQFYETIKILNSETVLGVSIEGVKFGRQSKISFISMTSNATSTVYIFDIVLIGFIPKEISDILESSIIKKVMHDSRNSADNLKFCHNINLNYIFDTMVANACISDEANTIKLFDCITKYFKVPKNIIQNSNIDWFKRPRTQEQIDIAAQNVVYLLELQTFLENILLKPFYNTVNGYMNSLINIANPIDQAMELCHNKNNGIKMIEKFELSISEDLIENLVV